MIATGNQGCGNGSTTQNELVQRELVQRGGYVDLRVSTEQTISVPGPASHSYLTDRLSPISQAYTDTVEQTDREFACLNRIKGDRVAVAEPEVHSYRMNCECLEQSCLMDLVEHVLNLRYESRHQEADDVAESRPILLHVSDYQEAVELDRRLNAFGVSTQLASPFSNWTSVLGKLGTGQIEVIITTTIDIPHVDQIAWQAIYLPSTVHLAMLTTPEMDWLGNYWFANNLDEQPPRLIVRRPAA